MNEAKRAKPSDSETRGRWAKLKTSNICQAAFVRPFANKSDWKKYMAVWLSYAFGLMIIVSSTTMLIDDALSWPVPLEQMHKTEGTLSSIVIQRRGPSYLIVTSAEGHDIRFFARWLPGTDLKTYIGRRVTVWSNQGFELFYGLVQNAADIQADGAERLTLGYQERIASGIEYDRKDHYWFLAMLALGLFLITRPVWKHRKPSIDLHHSTEKGA